MLALRGLASLALLACVALAGRARPRLAALLAFHPVVLWSAAEGHNDPFWLALVLARSAWAGPSPRQSSGFGTTEPSRVGRGLGGPPRIALLTAAAAVKAVALVPLVPGWGSCAGAGGSSRRPPRSPRSRWRTGRCSGRW